jgi:hypothetical protein
MYVMLYILIPIATIFLIWFICEICKKCSEKDDDDYDNISEGNYNSEGKDSDEEAYMSIIINEKKKESLLESILLHYTSVHTLENTKENCCSICLDNMEKGEIIRSLPCFHMYHSKCIDDWLFRNKNKSPICPDCTVPIVPK